MKGLLLASALLLAASAVAQSQPSSSNSTLSDDALAQLHANPVRSCAYIHAFIFERHDGEAPRLVKETYCTPTGQFTMKRALNFDLYPAVLSNRAEPSSGLVDKPEAQPKPQPKPEAKSEANPEPKPEPPR